MVEKQQINGKDVWLRVDAVPMNRANSNVIPREYFTAKYFYTEPHSGSEGGIPIKDEGGAEKLFESPVAALSYAWQYLKENDSLIVY